MVAVLRTDRTQRHSQPKHSRFKTHKQTKMSLQGSNDKEKLESLCKKTYKEQAVWFLNAFASPPTHSGTRLVWSLPFISWAVGQILGNHEGRR